MINIHIDNAENYPSYVLAHVAGLIQVMAQYAGAVEKKMAEMGAQSSSGKAPEVFPKIVPRTIFTEQKYDLRSEYNNAIRGGGTTPVPESSGLQEFGQVHSQSAPQSEST